MLGRHSERHAAFSVRPLFLSLVAVLGLIVGLFTPVAASAVVTPTAPASSVAAVSGPIAKTYLDGFDPGNIISDAVFFDKDTMSEGDIQSFLNARVPRCQSGYVCLKDAMDTSRNTSADAMCNAYTGAGRESAARIIYKVAQACGINPQVILATLQKEQGLVTHTWPSDWRYTIAMGQGCPDTAACDTAYYGFFNQVYGAARQFKRYANPPGTSRTFTWYAPGNTWNILYNPNHACGSSPVYIQNQATSNLYYYTPYQPNAAALRAGTGEGDGCSAYGNRNFYNYFTDWFGPTGGGGSGAGNAGSKHDPVGFLDGVWSSPGELRVQGWALDPDTSASIDVHIYVNGVGYATTASTPRPDLAPHYPGLGIDHGYDAIVPATTTGDASVCAYGINTGEGTNRLLGCTTVTSYGGSPRGAVEAVKAGKGEVTVSGWALDPDTADAIDVHVYVGSSGHRTVANIDRPGVTADYPLHGTKHGYSITVPSVGGQQSVCVYGINVKSGENVLLEPCRQVFVTAAGGETPPTGRIDGVTVQGNTVTVSGWALDPDTTASTDVHIYVGSPGKRHHAAQIRWDLPPADPGYGDAHGFQAELTLPEGRSQVCVYAIHDGAGPHTLLGCRTVEPTGSRAPIGNVEAAAFVDGGLQIAGWALDPDTAEPIDVHVYVDGVGYRLAADVARPDVGAAYPGSGANHGFSEVIPMDVTQGRVCVYAINDGAGPHSLLSCRTVEAVGGRQLPTEPAVPTEPIGPKESDPSSESEAPSKPSASRVPFGNVEALAFVDGGLQVAGWAIDPDTADPIEVHVYVDGVGYRLTAAVERRDVGAVYPDAGANHGFSQTIPMAATRGRVCVYAINDAAGDNPLLLCRSL